MSSSGLIYAVIVGAWAVYLVPMWLRREDELNHARQTQRYAAAIKVLSNKEAFERRWAKGEEVDLPLAVGQSTPVPPARPKSTPKKPASASTAPTARIANPARPKPAPPAAASSLDRTRVGLMARRRRVVALLFGLSTLGALVAADLGAEYLWVMAVPAALLSAYIVRLRKDERAKAAERARRKSAADQARTAREAEARSRAQAKARADAEADAQARVEVELEAFDRRQQQAAARRRTAAARSRAQSYTPQNKNETPLRKASNG